MWHTASIYTQPWSAWDCLPAKFTQNPCQWKWMKRTRNIFARLKEARKLLSKILLLQIAFRSCFLIYALRGHASFRSQQCRCAPTSLTLRQAQEYIVSDSSCHDSKIPACHQKKEKSIHNERQVLTQTFQPSRACARAEEHWQFSADTKSTAL